MFNNYLLLNITFLKVSYSAVLKTRFNSKLNFLTRLNSLKVESLICT